LTANDFCFRVSFGSSKGSMVETLVYENSAVSDEPEKKSKTAGTALGAKGTGTKSVHSSDETDVGLDPAG
jgi:hypothetical protein